MAFQATRTKAPVAAETLARSKSAGSAASDPIALDLAPLIAAHKKQGRVAIRVERMPQTARLSQGRNNGAGSWSLAQDELEDLAYLPPQGATGRWTLAIRIVGSEGATLAMHDFDVYTGTGSPKAEAAPPKHARNQHGAELVRALERERDALKAKLALREAEATEAISRAAMALDELKELRSRPDTKDVLTQAQKEWSASAQARLEAADAQWEKRFADAQANAERERNAAERMRSNAEASELRMLRDALQTAHAEIAARDAALADAKEAREEEIARFERARNDAHAAAEAEWQAAEALRMVAARQAWQREADAARAALSHKCERLAEDLALAREQSPPQISDGDRQEITGLRAELAASKSELAKVRAEVVAERAGWKSQSDEQLAKARKEWREAEVSRLASNRAQWRKKTERMLAAAAARYRSAEESLAQVRADAPEVAQADAVSQLREECTSLQIALAKRESEVEHFRLMTKTQGPPTPKHTVALHGDGEWRTIDQEEPERKISFVLVAQLLGVVLSAAMAVFSFPYMESSLPYDWQYDIDYALVNIEASIGMQTSAPQAVPALPVRKASAAPAILVEAIVAHSTKLHAKPAKSSDVVASLRRGTRVSVMETRNGWDRVQIAHNEKLNGWIPSAFLSDRAPRSSSPHRGGRHR
ncbi:MAG TPA: SH3 domain-containing protein [Rhizomicrobium sp.]